MIYTIVQNCYLEDTHKIFHKQNIFVTSNESVTQNFRGRENIFYLNGWSLCRYSEFVEVHTA